MDIGLQLILKIFYVGIPKMNKDSIQSVLVRFGGCLRLDCLIFGLDVGNKQNNGEQTGNVRQAPPECSPRLFHLFF